MYHTVTVLPYDSYGLHITYHLRTYFSKRWSPEKYAFGSGAKIACNNLEWSQVKTDMTLLKSNKCKINMSIGPWKWLVSDYALYPLNFRISDIIMQIIIRSRTNIEWKFDKNWKKWHLNLITFLYLTGMINKIIMVRECRIYKSF